MKKVIFDINERHVISEAHPARRALAQANEHPASHRVGDWRLQALLPLNNKQIQRRSVSIGAPGAIVTTRLEYQLLWYFDIRPPANTLSHGVAHLKLGLNNHVYAMTTHSDGMDE